MSTADLLALVWRWRVLVLLGLLMTGAAVVHVRSAPPLYWSQTELRVIAPSNYVAASSLTSSAGGLIAVAGLVVREVDKGDPPAVSDAADLPGLGVRDGWQLRLPNAGGQWEPDYDRPVIDLQVVGPDPREVDRTRDRLTAVVARELDAMQDADGIPPESRMRIQPDTARPPTMEMGGSRARAELVTVMLGLWGTLAAVLAAGPAVSALGRLARRLGFRPGTRSRRRRSAPLAGAA